MNERLSEILCAGATERPDITDLSKATADEVRALYGPMIGNAGVYEVYEFTIENNNLTLRQRRNVRGRVERGNVWTRTRVE